MSIIITGRYEELPDTPECEGARVIAHELLQRHAMWWQPAYTATVHRDPAQPLIPIYYRILIKEVTGHRATPEEAETLAPVSAGKERGWLHAVLHREKAKR
jgi:nitroimidazol reductase NimA-like FMN-containing flavoprotein (pyridoxamine 5'-phosphate oxidase superfamily)